MRVAIVGINYAPEPTGIPVYSTGMAEYLAVRGHEVTVYTGFAYYPHWIKSAADRWKLFRRETLNGVQVRRHYVYVPGKPTALKRMIHEISFVASSALGYLFGPRPDLTIIVSPPLFIGIPVALIAKLNRSRTIFHVQDMQPDAAVDLGMLKPGLLTDFFFAIERSTYRLADRVSTISHGMLEKIAAKGVRRNKLMLFRNWAQDDLVSPRDIHIWYRREGWC
jgi:colanic acid biosynthesis glycosyl transferase WcaI